MRDSLLHRAAGRRLDDYKIDQQDDHQGRDDQQQAASTLEKILKIPGIRRFVKVSDRGLSETLKATSDIAAQKEARHALDIREVVDKKLRMDEFSEDESLLVHKDPSRYLKMILAEKKKKGLSTIGRAVNNAGSNFQREAIRKAAREFNQ